MQTLRQLQFLFQDSDQQVGADGRPELTLHRVGGGAKKSPDAQVLFDQLKNSSICQRRL